MGQPTDFKQRKVVASWFHKKIHEHWNIYIYYIDESVLLGTKPLVDSIRHFIQDPSGVFSVYNNNNNTFYFTP